MERERSPNEKFSASTGEALAPRLLLVLSRVHIIVSRAVVSIVVETVPSSGNLLGSVTITTIMMN